MHIYIQYQINEKHEKHLCLVVDGRLSAEKSESRHYCRQFQPLSIVP